MSSIIVLDSDSEDESPPKKANFKSTPDFCNSSHALSKNQSSKQRIIPIGITITPRHSPVTQGKVQTNATVQSITSPLSGANTNHAINNIINNERQTPTPPKVPGNLSAQLQRKRKTPTPPQPMPRLAPKPFATMNAMSPAAAATTMAPLPPIMPMITGVHSMAAAGATPPLQLMATPPHNLGAFAALNEQMMINPHFIHTNLPPNTTITAHPNPNHNNINNNFKIHLPPKPVTTPSPAASPASSAPKTPSPQLAVSQGPRRADKSLKRINPTTVLRASDDAWLQQRQKLQAQLDRQNNEMVEVTMESPKSSSRQQTPMTSPSTPKSHKSPDVILVPTSTLGTKSSDVLDLTESPDRLSMLNVINLVDTPHSIQYTPKNKQVNGDDTSTKNSKTCVDSNGKSVHTPDTNKEKEKAKTPSKAALEPEYEELIKACREADKSDDMEKLIKNKLIKYYYDVHADFVKSKSFRKSIRKVVEAIRAEPDLVYYNLKTIVEELKVRRKARVVEDLTIPPVKSEESVTMPAAATDDSNSTSAATTTTTTQASSANVSAISNTSTGNKKLDEQIKKLNKALYVLTKRIEVLEQATVDWDDDDSSFLQVERFKKRACQIYEKICDLTGESKNARRLVKKPIKFNETRIPQFNKTLQAFINRTKEFPDYYDVLRMLEHCNRTYNLGLVNFEIKNIAEDAFIKVGKLLQSRRKADLYETVTHYGGNVKDPAQSDPTLAAKLSENLKNHKKISDILEKYARKQDMPDEEEEENKADNTVTSVDKKSPTQMETEDDSIKNTITDTEIEVSCKQESRLDEAIFKKETPNRGDVGESDDDDDDEDDEDEVNLEEHVETLANGDVSDNESDNENNGDNYNKEDKSKESFMITTPAEHIDIDDSVDVPEVQNIEKICDTLQTQTVTVDGPKTVNNNNIENPATKTVLNATAKDCKTPPNGKLKESTKLNICTTTATADVKIVAVSSLDNENTTSLKSSECSTKITSQSTNKSLEEIVISDEES